MPKYKFAFIMVMLSLVAGTALFPSGCLAGRNGNAPEAGAPDVVTAKACTIATHISAYGRVEPIAPLPLNAAQTGVVTGIRVLPGDTVRAGSVLGRLTGPAVNELLVQRRSALKAAGAALAANENILAAELRKQALKLTTQQAVDRAKADLAAAQAHFDNARMRMLSAREAVLLKAPADGAVLSVKAGDGMLVQAGQTILSLQPRGGLWLTAEYYGTDAGAVRVGMKGRFEPTGGGAAVPVQVRTIIGVTAPDGGRMLGLEATAGGAPWQNGKTGLVTLDGAKQPLVSVPTRALIVDRGRWWVLVHTDHGDRAAEVVPGPSRGESTLITRGIAPGTAVVVENAYLEFHRNVAQHYQTPD